MGFSWNKALESLGESSQKFAGEAVHDLADKYLSRPREQDRPLMSNQGNIVTVPQAIIPAQKVEPSVNTETVKSPAIDKNTILIFGGVGVSFIALVLLLVIKK